MKRKTVLGWFGMGTEVNGDVGELQAPMASSHPAAIAATLADNQRLPSEMIEG